MSLYQIAIEYILVYCTSVGLTSLGEPSLASAPEHIHHRHETSHNDREPMPVWIVFIFVFMAFAKWFITFLINYIYLLTTTIACISTTRIRTLSALRAETHSLSQRAQLDNLIRAIRVVGAFKSARLNRLKTHRDETSRRRSIVSVPEVRADLKRRSTLEIQNQQQQKHRKRPGPKPPSTALGKLWHRLTSLPMFRGFAPLITVSIAQWLLAFITDFLLSGQPPQHKLGYGTTSLVLKTFFASFYAVWTHYTLTKPSNKRTFDHFPKGGEVLIELWPLTALWAVADQLCVAAPLALSRAWGLRDYAFDARAWNTLTPAEVKWKLADFALVWLLYITLTLLISIPMTILTRRVHASMLSDEDLAIIPFHRHRILPQPYNKRSFIKKPGLTAGEAWETVTWETYWRVVRCYVAYWVVNQGVHMGYWGVNWWLHGVLGVGRYRRTKLPWSPVGVITSLGVEGRLPGMGEEGVGGSGGVGRTEL